MTRSCLSAFSTLDPIVRQARRILIACDFDGTLCPIANSPSEVYLAPYMLDVLRLISSSERVKLAIISGRGLADVVKRIPVYNLVVAGNHGLEISGAGITFEHDCARRLRPELERFCHKIAQILEPWTGAWIEDKGLSSTIHYRKVNPSQHHSLRCAVRRCVAGRNPSIGLRAASAALELYPKIGWGKGAALKYITDKCGPFDLCISIGDDYTDESMFREYPENINIKVGAGRPTSAAFHLAEPSSVAVFLQHVWDTCEIMHESHPVATPDQMCRAGG